MCESSSWHQISKSPRQPNHLRKIRSPPRLGPRLPGLGAGSGAPSVAAASVQGARASPAPASARGALGAEASGRPPRLGMRRCSLGRRCCEPGGRVSVGRRARRGGGGGGGGGGGSAIKRGWRGESGKEKRSQPKRARQMRASQREKTRAVLSMRTGANPGAKTDGEVSATLLLQ